MPLSMPRAYFAFAAPGDSAKVASRRGARLGTARASQDEKEKPERPRGRSGLAADSRRLAYMKIGTSSGVLRLYELLAVAPVTRRAVRFYEEQGLLLPAGRDA